jgi:hypothetical protein
MMKRMSGSLWIVSLLFLVAGSHGADRPRGAVDAERVAREFFDSGDYARAIPLLEKVTADYPSDLQDLSLLGMAYLYSSSRLDMTGNVKKAFETNVKVVELGGEAVFIVGRGDDPLKGISPHIVKVIHGELKISKGTIQFTPSRSATGATGPLGGTEIKECGLNKSYGRDSNAFHIKTSKETINFRPWHFSQDESQMVCLLLAKFMSVKTTGY